MKTLHIAVLSIGILLPSSISAQTGQTCVKIGHFKEHELLEAMPQYHEALAEMETYQAEAQARIEAMQEELQKVMTCQPHSQDSTIAMAHIEKAQQMQQRLEEHVAETQQQLAAKEVQLMAPIKKRIEYAVEKVAETHDYDYIVDSDAEMVYLVPGTDNIIDLLKAELGIK